MNTRTSLPARSRIAVWLSIILLAAMLFTIIPVAASTNAPEATGLNWVPTKVDTSEQYENMSSRSMRLDSSGNPGVVFGGRKLYYAKYNGRDWSITIVDSSYGVGSYASLAYDSSNRPHISYYDATSGKLKYATYWNNAWRINTISEAGTGNVGQYSSIDIDSNNKPHIVFYDATNQYLKYIFGTSYDDTNYRWNWDTSYSLVNSSRKTGKYASLDVDGTTPHVSYYHEADDILMYAVLENGVWRNVLLDRRARTDSGLTRGVGMYTSIVFARGKAYISYYDGIRGDLKYASVTRNNDGSFNQSIEVIDQPTGGDVGLYTSIALDNNRNPYISYFDQTNDNLKYAYPTKDGWKTKTIADTGRTGLYTSLAINPSNNRPRISFLDATQRSMRVVTLSNLAGESASFQTLQTAGTNGLFASMRLDSLDQPHIAYYDEGTPGLRYAHWNGTQWIYWILDTGVSNGLYASLDLDSNDHPHITYYNAATNDLRYIYWVGSDPSQPWSSVELVDEGVGNPPDVGSWASIAMDSNNNPHISYFDAANQRLLYAYKTSSGWTKGLQVDNSDNVGRYSSIALSASNIPHISYFDEKLDRLKYAYYVPQTSSWEHEVVDGDGSTYSTGAYSSLVIDPAGVAKVSFYDFTAYGGMSPVLKYAERVGPSNWNVTIVDGEPRSTNLTTTPADLLNVPATIAAPNDDLPVSTGVGAFTSLALDSANRPHISYYDANNGDLKYAFYTPFGWELRTAYSVNNSGYYTSIAIGSNDLPRISFQDATLGELLFTTAAILDHELFLPMNINWFLGN